MNLHTSFSLAIVNHNHAEPGNTFQESLTVQFGIRAGPT